MPGIRKIILILGGTSEASDLATRLADRHDMKVITSLAGRTTNPRAIDGEIRIGGFGGTDGLASYLKNNGIDLLVDATHPFATAMSANAAAASERTDTPLLSLVRPPWSPIDGDNWRSVGNLEDACEALPAAARVFLALGHQHIAEFAGRDDVHFVIRVIDPPAETPLFRSVDFIVSRPVSAAQEESVLRSNAISHLVCRNSGGEASYAKLEAARRLSIPVIMIERPPLPAGSCFNAVDELVAAIG